MKQPRVAVLMPCFDEGEVMLESVASVREEEPVELVVIDDCSQSPRTHELLAELERGGVRVLRQPRNGGPAAARTAGLRATTARYVFPLDADDLVEAGMLARLADLLDRSPDAAVAYGDHVEFGDGPEVFRPAPNELDPFRLLYVFEYPPAALFRRTELEPFGGWQPVGLTLRAYEDWHVWMSLAERGARGAYVGQGVVTYRRRLHGSRLLARARRQHPQLYRALKRAHPDLFARRRELRGRSTLGWRRKVLYPVFYGGRPKFAWEPRLRLWLERRGVRVSGG